MNYKRLQFLLEELRANRFNSPEELKDYYIKLFYELLNITPISYPNIDMILNKADINKIYLTSDIHFMSNGEDDELKIFNHNKVIKNDCVLICLGDITNKYNYNPDILSDLIKRLNKGYYSILCFGNHDVAGKQFYMNCGFDFVCRGFIWHDICFTHIPIKTVNNKPFHVNIHGHLHRDNVMDHKNSKQLYDFNKVDITYIKVYTCKENNYQPVKLIDLLNKFVEKEMNNSYY